MKDKDYLKSLIKKYWFIGEEILNDDIYYSLEGYLAPNTYSFRKNTSVKEIFNAMISEMDQNLSKYKNIINNSKYTPHELLTLASIVELEGSEGTDRKGIAGVFYNRLPNNPNIAPLAPIENPSLIQIDKSEPVIALTIYIIGNFFFP